MTRGELFLARADEVRRFSEALDAVRDEASGEGWPTIVLVHGLGGIGKSSLLRHLRQTIDNSEAVAWLDFEDERRLRPVAFGGDAGPGLTTVLDTVMRACLEAMKPHRDLKVAQDAFDDYRVAVARLPVMLDQIRGALAEAQQTGLAKEDIVALEKSAVAVAALVAQQPVAIPAAVGAASALGQSALARAGFFRRLAGAPKVAADDYAFVADPQRALARTFGECVATLSGYRPLVVFLDTSEIVLAQLPWLREAMHAAGGRTLWVIGARLEAEQSAEADSESAAFVRQVPSDKLRLIALTRFDDETVRRYLENRVPGRTFDDGDVDRVSRFTKGLPLAVSLVADLLVKEATLDEACAEVQRPTDSFAPVTAGQVVSALARRFLTHTERLQDDRSKQDLHRILCLAIANGYPTRDPQVLKALWNTDEDLFDACRALASRHDFVLSGSFRLHDDVRDALRADLMEPVSHMRIEEACRRATEVLQASLAQRRTILPTLQSQLKDEKYLATVLDYVWYSFWTSTETGWRAALTILPILAVTDESAANSLVGMIEWFVRWGGADKQRRFAELAAERSIFDSIFDELLATLKGGPVSSSGSLGVKITPDGLHYLSDIGSIEGILGTSADRSVALSLLELRFAVVPGRGMRAAEVERLIDLGSSSDQAFKTSVSEALSDAADGVRVVEFAVGGMRVVAGTASDDELLVAAKALVAADSMASQSPWRFDELAGFLAERPNVEVRDYAEELYRRTVEADPKNANHLGNYAIFLMNVRGDHDGAEELFQQALEADPKNAYHLGSYAWFLTHVRGDHDGAEDLYRRAVETDPKNANHLGNYARTLFIVGRDDEAELLAAQALELAGDAEDQLRAECNFYLFVHVPSRRVEAGTRLKELMAGGVTTGSWDFGRNLERLQRESDPRLPMLTAVAEALRSGDSSDLEQFEEWRSLGSNGA